MTGRDGCAISKHVKELTLGSQSARDLLNKQIAKKANVGKLQQVVMQMITRTKHTRYSLLHSVSSEDWEYGLTRVETNTMLHFLYNVFAITAVSKMSDGNTHDSDNVQSKGRRTSNSAGSYVAKALFIETLVIDDETEHEQILKQRKVCIDMLQNLLPSTSDFIWQWYDDQTRYVASALNVYTDNTTFKYMDAVATIFSYARTEIKYPLVDAGFKCSDRMSSETQAIQKILTEIRIRTISRRQTDTVYTTVRKHRKKWRAYYVPLHQRAEKSTVDIVITLPDPQREIIEKFTKTFIVPFSRSTRFNIMLRNSTQQSVTIQDTEPSKGCQELKDMLHNFNLNI
jgi:hypothetical protein